MAEKSGFAIQTTIAESEVEYDNEEEVVEEQYEDDAISMDLTPPPPPAPFAAGDRRCELRQQEAPPVCTIHSTLVSYTYITFSRERSLEQMVGGGGGGGGKEGGQANK